jgi:Niemann-Pick C1 protein
MIYLYYNFNQSYWQEELLPMVQSSNLTLSYSSESSIEEELKRESTADIITIAVSHWRIYAFI